MTAPPPPDALTLVLDVGKTHARLLLIDAAGQVQAQAQRDSASLPGALDYPALDVAGLRRWWLQTVATWPAAQRQRVSRLVATTHGAAFCGLAADAHWDDAEGGLALPVMDYEWDGPARDRDPADPPLDPFALTGSPELPLGLNAGRQLRWLQRHRPQAWDQAAQWLPYPQYWAWWWSGVAASERSSLGCHTHLWSPVQDGPSPWAQRLGLSPRLAPLRGAAEALGPLRPDLARRAGLPEDALVLCGLHDSNACLARYRDLGDAVSLVSSGTWTVVMSPGGEPGHLQARRDQLVNVAVDGRPVPTARFMGGREFAEVCAGADPALAGTGGSLARLEAALAQEWWALPAFAQAGGPFATCQPPVHGRCLQGWEPARPVGPVDWAAQPPERRVAVASLYLGQMTAWLLQSLGGQGPVVVEGPMTRNAQAMAVLATLLGHRTVHASADPLEGTARGAWRLAQPASAPATGRRRPRPEASAAHLSPVAPLTGFAAERLRSLHILWLSRVASLL
ncbi:hypothetical protein [Ideonella livida]|uniref:Carbohydrate kinase FGGY C-terminal domain-containing protein n=1 Tax=Ideonella livida TaxID=2707176 RepID=A0A7C9PK72_9BURK|nr:hypothetical protein [Ideonella livida]NDY93993.1 hypothetical protein [Ideonella livida]